MKSTKAETTDKVISVAMFPLIMAKFAFMLFKEDNSKECEKEVKLARRIKLSLKLKYHLKLTKNLISMRCWSESKKTEQILVILKEDDSGKQSC